MPTIPTLLAFALTATLLIVVPGSNLIYIITRGIEGSRRAAVARQRERFSGAVSIVLGLVAALTGSSSAKSR